MKPVTSKSWAPLFFYSTVLISFAPVFRCDEAFCHAGNLLRKVLQCFIIVFYSHCFPLWRQLIFVSCLLWWKLVVCNVKWFWPLCSSRHLGFHSWFEKLICLSKHHACLHQPPHTTLVVFYVSIPPFPCLPPLVSCLNHKVCFSFFFSFLVPCGFAPCCGNDKLSVPLGEKGVKKRVCGWFLDPAGPSRHPLHQMGLADCTGLTPTTSSFVLIVWISLLSVHGHNKKWEWGQN